MMVYAFLLVSVNHSLHLAIILFTQPLITLWNHLPFSITNIASVNRFKKVIKTFLFAKDSAACVAILWEPGWSLVVCSGRCFGCGEGARDRSHQIVKPEAYGLYAYILVNPTSRSWVGRTKFDIPRTTAWILTRPRHKHLKHHDCTGKHDQEAYKTTWFSMPTHSAVIDGEIGIFDMNLKQAG